MKVHWPADPESGPHRLDRPPCQVVVLGGEVTGDTEVIILGRIEGELVGPADRLHQGTQRVESRRVAPAHPQRKVHLGKRPHPHDDLANRNQASASSVSALARGSMPAAMSAVSSTTPLRLERSIFRR